MQYAILLNKEKAIPNKDDLTKDAQELAVVLQPSLFKGWQFQQTTKKTVEQETRRYLRRKYVSQNYLTLPEMDVLYQKIIYSVKTYA